MTRRAQLSCFPVMGRSERPDRARCITPGVFQLMLPAPSDLTVFLAPRLVRTLRACLSAFLGHTPSSSPRPLIGRASPTVGQPDGAPLACTGQHGPEVAIVRPLLK